MQTETLNAKNGNLWTAEALPFAAFFPEQAATAYSRNIAKDGGLLVAWALTEDQINTFESLIARTPDEAKIYVVAAWNAAIGV